MHDRQVAGRGQTGISRVHLSLNISGTSLFSIPWLRLQLQLGGGDDSGRERTSSMLILQLKRDIFVSLQQQFSRDILVLRLLLTAHCISF